MTRAACLAALLLAGCAKTITACPPLATYSPEFTAAFIDQLATIPEGSPVAVFILDAKLLRDQVRECQ